MSPDDNSTSCNPDPDESTLSEDEIHLLTRLDERTEQIDEKLEHRTEKVENKVERAIQEAQGNAKDIDELQDSVQRNTTILGGFSVGVSSVLLWFADKVTRVI